MVSGVLGRFSIFDSIDPTDGYCTSTSGLWDFGNRMVVFDQPARYLPPRTAFGIPTATTRQPRSDGSLGGLKHEFQPLTLTERVLIGVGTAPGFWLPCAFSGARAQNH